ncbi:MAG: carboxylating nicotinate-nucleotide diphosphorylase [Phycisphaerales bacterium]|nr:MAG: carboxylating nicotinate-nucleotide diphosphorylase [Phycisphaerales bacterium]
MTPGDGTPIDLNALSLEGLYAELARSGAVRTLFDLAREEDMGDAAAPMDVTSASIVPEHASAVATVRARRAGVAAGLRSIPELLAVYGGACSFLAAIEDGASFERGAAIGVLRGPLRDVLAVERPLLNTLGRCCGVATFAHDHTRSVEGTSAVICETRKTIPGWRVLDKYSCRCGGATLHRLGLFDAALYKDNHLAHIPDEEWTDALTDAIRRARAGSALRFVEVEADTLAQLERVLTVEAGLVDIVLLDNMTTDELAAAVAMRNKSASRPLFEASGGVRMDRLREIASTGVERISVGALTHGAPSLDLGLDIDRG